MDAKGKIWLILLLLCGCTEAAPGAPEFVAGPLQPNNCGTPYQFKPCARSAAGTARLARPTVTIEEVDDAGDRIINTRLPQSPDGGSPIPAGDD
jgi:hypothetical protein